jgi:hypothetical protein
MRLCALNTSSETLFLDHISPLASHFKAPLIATDERNVSLTRKYYPDVELRYWPDLEFRLGELAREFDALVECNFWAPHLKHLFRTLYQKEMKLITCPHGQSDKGYGAPTLTPYATQEMALFYGDLLKEMLFELGIAVPDSISIGNFRYDYYERQKGFLADLADREVFSRFSARQPTLFYAPTWRDLDESTSFFDWGKRVASDLPNDWNLLIKVHPLLSKKDPVLYHRLHLLEKGNFIVVDEFPPIYPLLDRVDAYLGDYSSVGYDFLTFRKPMFFFQKPHLRRARLHQCGSIIDPERNIFQQIEEGLLTADRYQEAQSLLYKKAFGALSKETVQ